MLAIVVVTVWLGVLTVVSLLLVRQVAIFGLRLERGGGGGAANLDDGLPIGAVAPLSLKALSAASEPSCFLVLSAICAPCREFAAQLARARISEHVVALIAGRSEPASALADLMPKQVTVVRDPDASTIARDLEVETTPYAIVVSGGVITAKGFLHSVEDMRKLVQDPVRVALPMAEVRAKNV